MGKRPNTDDVLVESWQKPKPKEAAAKGKERASSSSSASSSTRSPNPKKKAKTAKVKAEAPPSSRYLAASEVTSPRGRVPTGCVRNKMTGKWDWDGKTYKKGCVWVVGGGPEGRGCWQRAPSSSSKAAAEEKADAGSPSTEEIVACLRMYAQPVKGMLWSEEHGHLIPRNTYWDEDNGVWTPNGYFWDDFDGLVKEDDTEMTEDEDEAIRK